MTKSLRLNLGGATNPIPGYTVVDRRTGQEIYPLAYSDSSAELIRASHCLEHISHRKTLDVICDWVRVLQPGGLLKIAVPDFDWILDVYREDVNRNTDNYYILGGSIGVPSEKYVHPHREMAAHVQPIEAYLMGGQLDSDDFHFAIFTEWKLRWMMETAGLIQIERWTGDKEDCSGLPVRLNLQGTKPE